MSAHSVALEDLVCEFGFFGGGRGRTTPLAHMICWNCVPAHTKMARLSQPCDMVVTTLLTTNKVVTTLSLGC